ncbi:ATP-grasp domain-containing protein [Chelativorans sp. M5D2P16]|uniref:ATP-grasp domain-containing protein n=1 Tax=Chelativorans sp. M5D2P16 TaxID=3095678 RepID=UPI002ACA4AD0|nr:ATP-grasp domain-containing protein [Chelativorans sp. M5D2P16]MDZ5696504.1 ATP-grasp domain-containing protein [Chelativorans sp. M5D2P16]
MRMTLLVSSAGRRVGLVECFRSSAAAIGIELEVLACDRDPQFSAACQVADRAFAVPRCDDPEFVETMLEIVRENGVNLVVPTIDPELAPLAGAAHRFRASGAHVHVSPPGVIEVVRDKLRTAQVMEAAGVPVPWTVPLEAAHASAYPIVWPMFLKPSGGSASRNIKVATSSADLPEAPEEPMILQQLLIGPEYTVNMYIDREGDLRNAVAHRRLRVRAGEVEKGRTERDPVLRRLAEGVARALPLARGVLCFQVIADERTGPCVFDINARFGGGYPLVHYAGGEYTRWLLEEVAGLPSTAHDNWRAGALMLRYDAAVFQG